MNAEKFWEATMPVIKPALHHVTFKTARLDEMMAWYATVLGGKINFKDDHNGWMTNDQANHRFAFLSVPGLEDDPDKVKHNAMHHSAFEYESFSDLMSSYARMRDEGIVPAFSLDQTGNRRGCLAQGGRFQSSCAILERNLKDYVGLWKLERHGRSWSDARRSRPNNSLRISRQRLAER